MYKLKSSNRHSHIKGVGLISDLKLFRELNDLLFKPYFHHILACSFVCNVCVLTHDFRLFLNASINVLNRGVQRSELDIQALRSPWNNRKYRLQVALSARINSKNSKCVTTFEIV